MEVRDWMIVGATAAALATGCGGSNGTRSTPPPAGGNGSDGGAGGGGDGCAHVVDLTTRSGSGWTWHGTTVGAPDTMHPGCVAMGTDAGEVVLRFTPPDGVTAVKVTTDSPDTRFNTVLYARDMCGQAGTSGMPPADRACNDDDYTSPPDSTVYLTDLTPGQAVYLVVDGTHAEPPAGAMAGAWGISSGEATVTVTPVAFGAMGSPCRPAMDPGDGGAAPPRCDGALVCSEGTGGAADGTALCVPSAALGAMCDTRGFQNACATGATCATDPATGDATMARCMAAGTGAGARCRTAAPRCDGDLVCGTGDAPMCVRQVMRGAECDATGATNACAPGTTCQADDAGMATCR